MHNKEDEHTIAMADMPPQGHALKPENDEREIARLTEERFNDHIFVKGQNKGWADAIESLKALNLTDAAERLEALNNGQGVPRA